MPDFKVEMVDSPPEGCGWGVGDVVMFTNDYGVEFGPHTVIGFTKPGNDLYGRCVYLDHDCYWFPARPDSLRPYYFRTCGKSFRVRLVVESADEANVFCLGHPDVGVIGMVKGRIVVADLQESQEPVG